MSNLFGDSVINTDAKLSKDIDIKKFKEIKFDEKILDNVFTIKNLLGHDEIQNEIINKYVNNKIYHAIIFTGTRGIGKATLIYNIAAKIILHEVKNMNTEMIENITNAIKYNEYNDIFTLKSDEKGKIKLEEVKKMLKFLELKSYFGTKIVIIDAINEMNLNGLNAILKTLEEPNKNTYFFIIHHNDNSIIQTIKSRCNIIKLKSISKDNFKKLCDMNRIYYNDILYNMLDGSFGILKNIVDYNLLDRCLKIVNDTSNIKTLREEINNFYRDMKNQDLSEDILLIIIEKIFFFTLFHLCINTKKDEYINLINSFMMSLKNTKHYEMPFIY